MEVKNAINRTHLLALSTLAIIFLSPLVQAEIGIGAVVIDTQIEGKGDFNTNDTISVGDIITTGPKGNVTILFDDESMLTLGPNAKAKVVKFSETPTPGISEIEIISGGFRYFPGVILENGGPQILKNIAGTRATDNSNLSLSHADQPLNDDNLTALNEQLTDVNSQLNDINSQLNFADLISSTNLSDSAASGGNTGGQGNGGISGRP